MKPTAIAIAFVAFTMSACSLSFGTVGTWSNGEPPPTSIQGTTAVVLPDREVVFLGGFDPRTGQPLNQVLLFDPQNNRWTQGAPMPVQETGYAVAALSNSSVLIAGGGGLLGGVGAIPVAGAPAAGSGGGNGLLATTWLYSPQLNMWKKGGNLNVARSGAAAVLLTNGQVLIAGGSVPLATPIQLPDGSTDLFGFSNSAEMFDRETNSWNVVGSMHVARGSEALLALPHGMAVAAGGCAFANQGFVSGVALSSAEVFDPASGAWTMTAPLPESRCGASGLLLPDGRALVTGGALSSFLQGSVTSAFVYDTQQESWTAAGSTVPGASAPILLADGQVFLAAVQAGPVQGHVASLVLGGQLFDPSSGDWTFATSTTVLVSSRSSQPPPPVVIPKAGGTAIVLLGTPGLALAFDASGAPPPVLILDSSGLELLLGVLAVVLCLWLAIQYVRNRVKAD
jgi:Galactose oxidase, central domain/Kelch motif